ncbi:hypothetical protein OG948_57950 (plasmid) [Embleya sp. NBC_00888]|uniref:hypothetical protein n=1 Tax=Embleya sp. NBC_00888 TaxID=2975960 RepID=UPI003864AE86|nr:hypothetical protein OG948_57950 [Embleya sp. NBC_00888]
MAGLADSTGRVTHLEASTVVPSPRTVAGLGRRPGPEAEFHVLDLPHPGPGTPCPLPGRLHIQG